MRILGVDPSLTDTGWAVLEVAGKAEPPKLVAKGRVRTQADEFFVLRYARHRDEIAKVIEKYAPDYVSIEKPHHDSSWSAGLYPIWISIAEVCFRRRISFVTFLPSQIKVFGRILLNEKGKMYKSDMVDAAKALLQSNKALNHNIADAVLIAWGGALLFLLATGKISENDLTKQEQHLYTRTVTRQKTGIVDKVGHLYKEGDLYYDLSLSKYEEYFMDPKVRARRLENAEEVPAGTRRALIKAGYSTMDSLLANIGVDPCGDEEGFLKKLKEIKGVGKKGAEKTYQWVKRILEDVD